MEKGAIKPVVPMPVKATPYQHQIEAFNLACRLFGVVTEEASRAVEAVGSACRELERTVGKGR